MGNPTNPNRVVRVKDLDRFKVKNDGLYATLTAMAQAVADVTPDYIDIEDLEPGMTFPKNALLAINGISFQALRNTTDFPVVLLVESGHVVYDEDENGNKALVVSDWTKSEDWKVWGDAGINYSLGLIDNRLTYFNSLRIANRLNTIELALNNISGQIASISSTLLPVTIDGVTYSVRDILTTLAQLMDKNIVIDETEVNENDNENEE